MKFAIEGRFVYDSTALYVLLKMEMKGKKQFGEVPVTCFHIAALVISRSSREPRQHSTFYDRISNHVPHFPSLNPCFVKDTGQAKYAM